MALCIHPPTRMLRNSKRHSRNGDTTSTSLNKGLVRHAVGVPRRNLSPQTMYVSHTRPPLPPPPKDHAESPCRGGPPTPYMVLPRDYAVQLLYEMKTMTAVSALYCMELVLKNVGIVLRFRDLIHTRTQSELISCY